MKSLIKTTCTALLFTGILTGCNSNTTSKQEKSALEKNAMHYGEIVKNEYYRATVENAKFEKIDKERRLTTRVMINKVRDDGQTIDLSEIKYFIQDEKTGEKYEGEAHPIDDEHYKNVPHEFSLTTDVVFELKTSPKDLNNMYLYICKIFHTRFFGSYLFLPFIFKPDSVSFLLNFSEFVKITMEAFLFF